MTDNSITKQYIIENDAWYTSVAPIENNYTDEVTVGFYHEDGSTEGSFAIRWYPVGFPSQSSARIEAFHDSWRVLSKCRDLIDDLGSLEELPSVRDVLDALDRNGFKDTTPRTSPYTDNRSRAENKP